MKYQSRCRICGHRYTTHFGANGGGRVECPAKPYGEYIPKDNLEYCVWINDNNRNRECKK